MSVNKVTIVGNLGRDPELRYTQGGAPVASLSIATTRKWRSKQTNELVEETEWHRVVVWGQQAEHCGNYLRKGRLVYVDGRLRTRSYDDKDGIKRYSTEVIADEVQFLGPRTDGKQEPRQPGDDGDELGARSKRERQGENWTPPPQHDDDIPF